MHWGGGKLIALTFDQHSPSGAGAILFAFMLGGSALQRLLPWCAQISYKPPIPGASPEPLSEEHSLALSNEPEEPTADAQFLVLLKNQRADDTTDV